MLFADLSHGERRDLDKAVRRRAPDTDIAAHILGRDLWRGELVRWRETFIRIAPPPMWRFPFGASAQWATQRWLGLSRPARIFRGRIGPLAGNVPDTAATRGRASLPAKVIGESVRALQNAGLLVPSETGGYFPAIAAAVDLATDLALVELIAHWLSALHNADQVADAKRTEQCEVYGYAGACAICRVNWTVRSTGRWSLPPFHPGCRCFAQPRYQSS